ncbi:hypothetical protein MLD38_000966 [Melastoma candidum]|uniref:Uncharacterized protein n=1 Tax=Melastoma candidum TaxID=119954 RepID=A0ACB9SF24_9MYRT|nr:hypothetical protein MLD38_000966 [Melastoma candidum]
MDSEIWSKLPVEILDHILTFLPLKSLLILASTCRHFHSLLSSPAFASRADCRSRLSPSSSAFLVLSHPHSHRHHFRLYDSLLGSWRSSPLPSSSSSALLLSTSNSLFCFSLPSSSAFLISNLLTRSSRLIPFPSLPFSASSFELLSFVSTPASGYRILASSSRSSPAFLYDSRSLSWRRFDSFNLRLSRSRLGEGVYFEENFYFATSDRHPVSRFDPESGVVERCGRGLELLENELTFCRLVSDGERRLFLVGGVGPNGISRGVKVWVRAGDGWAETERVPEMICRKLMSVCYHNYEHVYCLWHQGMICICCYTWPEVLYYRESRGTWHWLPKCPSLPEKWSCGFRWYSFLPEISATV